MAVTMVIGNKPEVSVNLLAASHSMASVIANEFAEATNELHTSALMACGAVLLFVTLVVNAIARWLVWSVAKEGQS
jgi:phosphate transport system permease protein